MDNNDDDEIERMLNEAAEAADILLGPIENMDEARVRRYVPEITNKPIEYFRAIVKHAAEEAALAYLAKGEPIPPHVRSALGGDWKKPDEPKRNLGD